MTVPLSINTAPGKILQRFLWLLLLVFTEVYALDCEDFIDYRQGQVPILLTAPHGAPAAKKIPGVPPRTGEQVPSAFVTRADQHTDVITQEIYEELKRRGLPVFVVIAGIHRSQIDFNRPAGEAYETPSLSTCYRGYHQSIREAIVAINRQWGRGFLLDIHGQSKYNYDILRGTRNRQTIASLLQHFGSDVTEAEEGFFYLLRQKGYRMHPAVSQPERYFIGGYTLKTYGSHQEGGIDALQIELGRALRVDSSRRQQLIMDISEAIDRFYHRYYADRG